MKEKMGMFYGLVVLIVSLGCNPRDGKVRKRLDVLEIKCFLTAYGVKRVD